MTKIAYQFIIRRAEIARDLHAVHAEICADEALTSDERDELCGAIREKFARLNRAAIPNPKPRW